MHNPRAADGVARCLYAHDPNVFPYIRPVKLPKLYVHHSRMRPALPLRNSCNSTNRLARSDQTSSQKLIWRTGHVYAERNKRGKIFNLSMAAIKALKALPKKTDGRVFALQAESMSQAFERACEEHRANISNLRFHDLRHEATSRLFEKGLNVMEVAAVTGHKTLDMLKRYTHLRAEDLARKIG